MQVNIVCGLTSLPVTSTSFLRDFPCIYVVTMLVIYYVGQMYTYFTETKLIGGMLLET